MPMRNLAISAMAFILLSAVALADDPGAADTQPDGTVVLSGGSVAAGVGYVWGGGDLTYTDGKHKFSISGVSVADAGAANISATGNVYHLQKLSDFAGNYVAASAGVTIGGGGSATYLKNEHGVVIKLVSTTVGLRFTLSASGVNVKLKS